MNITRTEIFRGSLIASIAHAIMTNVYPDLSYEQSWDGANYSIQNTTGLRGTITFDNDYCVGAIRNDTSDSIVGNECIRSVIKNFPLKIIDKVYEEALQYLLVEREGIAVPCVTSVFWADATMIYYQEGYVDNLKKDFNLLTRILLPEEIAIGEWKEYYGMDSNAIDLLRYLYHEKRKCFTAKIELNEEQKSLIPGNEISRECIESLKELNICCE